MNSDIAIRVEGLGKKYLIGHQNADRGTTFREAMVHGTRNMARMAFDMMRGRALVAGDSVEEFWALRDVDFEIKRGEVVGVIGRNGAGKSTLLKVLSRITEPTLGRVAINGRVASLLEVGTGFHPELTGRENIYLNGAILGMRRSEITRKFDEIVQFAEVERFLDTPVKRYSSGMYVRLAFAVASSLESEVLIVDEVLAVGDAAFQKKCLNKMKSLASGSGRTVLFVSHEMAAVQRLCERAVWLEGGRVSLVGRTNEVIAAYLKAGNVGQEHVGAQVLHASADLHITKIEVNGSGAPALVAGQSVEICIAYECTNVERYSDGIQVAVTLWLGDQKIVCLWSAYCPQLKIHPRPRGVIRCHVDEWPFREMSFCLETYANAIGGGDVWWIRNAMNIPSFDGDFHSSGRLAPPKEGILFTKHHWAHDGTSP